MRKRHLFGAGLVVLAILLTLVVWQVSFNFGEFGPTNAAETFLFWAVSTLIFLLTVTLGFMLFRETVKLYLERQRNREGSRIHSKLVFGALALSLLPVVFLVVFSYVVLNRNLDKWFSAPVEGMNVQLRDAAVGLGEEVQARADALAHWLAATPEVRNGTADFAKLCRENKIEELRIDTPAGQSGPVRLQRQCAAVQFPRRSGRRNAGGSRAASCRRGAETESDPGLPEQVQPARGRPPVAAKSVSLVPGVDRAVHSVRRHLDRAAVWRSRSACRFPRLLEAASEVRKGNLGYRVNVPAIDELATLVRAFNEMMQELEANSRELESRRRFTEAILESIPTGVISLTSDGRIQRVNRALHGLFPPEQVERAAHLGDLFPPEDAAEIRYLMKRARRTGVAASQIDLERPGQVLHLAVTVSALPAHEPDAPGFVVVLEDTSELLRAQKAAAWHEVARRIAHELKNPLTPIALSAERIARQLDRGVLDAGRRSACCASARHHFARSGIGQDAGRRIFAVLALPGAQPVPCDLNDVVRNGLDVFDGRLDGIDLRVGSGARSAAASIWIPSSSSAWS